MDLQNYRPISNMPFHFKVLKLITEFQPERLQSWVSQQGKALQQFHSYLSYKSVSVVSGDASPRAIICCHNLTFHCYADDTQLFIQVKSSSSTSLPQWLSVMDVKIIGIQVFLAGVSSSHYFSAILLTPTKKTMQRMVSPPLCPCQKWLIDYCNSIYPEIRLSDWCVSLHHVNTIYSVPVDTFYALGKTNEFLFNCSDKSLKEVQWSYYIYGVSKKKFNSGDIITAY